MSATNVIADLSVTDLGKLLGGEEASSAPATPAADPAPAAPATPAAAAPEPAAAAAPEAAAVTTPAAEPETKIEGEEITPASTQEHQKPEKKSWVDKRLGDLAAKRREAEDTARYERERAERLQRELDAAKAGPGPKETAPEGTDPGKRGLQSFVDDLKDGESYELAVERYYDHRDNEKRVAAEKDNKAQADKAQTETFQKDWDKARIEHPDFDDLVGSVTSVAPEPLQVAISHLKLKDGSAAWPKLTVYLAEHQDVLREISNQYTNDPFGAVARLGEIRAALSPAAAAPNTEAPKPKVAAAPKAAPLPPVALGSGTAAAILDLEKVDMNTFAREMKKYGI